MNFFEASFLWKEAAISTIVIAGALGVTGTYTILRKVVFLPAALSQVSGLGVITALALSELMPSFLFSSEKIVVLSAFSITLIVTLLLGRIKTTSVVSLDTLIGVIYIGATALIIILSNQFPTESHHVEDLLFGNAVIVDKQQMQISIAIAIVVLTIHVLFCQSFMFVSMDTETALAHGRPVTFINTLLFITIALTITTATKTIGALPTFVFSILPPYAALQLFSKTRAIFIFSGLSASVLSFLGYWISFELDMPTGATSTVFTMIVCLGCTAIGKKRRTAS